MTDSTLSEVVRKLIDAGFQEFKSSEDRTELENGFYAFTIMCVVKTAIDLEPNFRRLIEEDRTACETYAAGLLTEIYPDIPTIKEMVTR